MTGRFDHHLRVACADVDELDQRARTIREGREAHTETRLVLRAAAYRHGVG